MSKFDPKYMLRRLYANDLKLGGNRLKDEEALAAQDPFLLEKDSILDRLRDIKKKQDERNEIRRTVGRNHHMMGLNREIIESIKSCDKRIDELNVMLRGQSKKSSAKDMKLKEEAWQGLKEMIKSLKEREKKSMDIKPMSEIAEENEMTTIDMDTVGRAPVRDLTKKEKKFLKLVDEGNKEIDEILVNIDKGMDQLLIGVEEITENLDEQKQRIKSLEKGVDKLTNNLEKSNKQLKKNLKRFRSATNVLVDIGMILILFVLIGVLIKVLS